MTPTAPSSTTAVDPSSAVAPAFRLSPVYGVLIWLPLVFVAAGAMGLWHFVSFAFVSNPVLNGLILAVALWGASTMANTKSFRPAWIGCAVASGAVSPTRV